MGAGRVMSRTAAVARHKGRRIDQELAEEGVIAECRHWKGLAEEQPSAYKDVSMVVEVVHRAGLPQKSHASARSEWSKDDDEEDPETESGSAENRGSFAGCRRGACCPCHSSGPVAWDKLALGGATAHWVRRWAIARFAILSHATHYGRKFLFVTRTWPVYNSRVGWVARHRLAKCCPSLRACEKMGTGSAVLCVRPGESRQREVPVPIFSQVLRERQHDSRG